MQSQPYIAIKMFFQPLTETWTKSNVTGFKSVQKKNKNVLSQ